MPLSAPTVGILDLQGDVIEHVRAFERCGASVVRVKTVAELETVEGLVFPGGESTTIGKLMQWYGLDKAIARRVEDGMPIYGTCAGAILMAREIVGKEQAPNLGLMDITVERNAYGRQIDSFETSISVRLEGRTQSPALVEAVFIRAPKIVSVGSGVEVLSRFENEIIMVRQGHRLASTFHPEMTENPAIPQYFLTMLHDSR